MNIMKIKKICQPVRIAAGAALIATAVATGNPWFFLGLAPLVAGIMNFCPLCIITKKCDI